MLVARPGRARHAKSGGGSVGTDKCSKVNVSDDSDAGGEKANKEESRRKRHNKEKVDSHIESHSSPIYEECKTESQQRSCGPAMRIGSS